ncbi:haloacid dehalogenase type II [Paraburkholderia phenoliruptrix]|uniref:haloacid dehalogenase type II n=1 Tax=Paraburkholderia phenoliruptrix TaxID=252970 RepID=UPI002869DFFA|nr:haloacid dehalogenase type II [Paraburkholderia phenoliruptrix]WMY11786.1 haloacid dehalogenase type II [Paraburkholderia phenoliruptrix]
MKVDLGNVKAIVFDTFGTVVDWRSSIINDLSAWGGGRGLDADWPKLVDRWRALYEPQKDRVRKGEIPWTNLDELHLDALKTLLPEIGLGGLRSDDISHINKVWHRLKGWPEASQALVRLKSRFIIGPLSNGNVALLVDMAKHAGLPWDAIFSCELFRHYKPHPSTYLGVCQQLYLQPEEVMMCAAHNYDLRAARAVGLRTAFIPRPTEYGPGQTTDLSAEEDWDVVAKDLLEFASRMGT